MLHKRKKLLASSSGLNRRLEKLGNFLDDACHAALIWTFHFLNQCKDIIITNKTTKSFENGLNYTFSLFQYLKFTWHIANVRRLKLSLSKSISIFSNKRRIILSWHMTYDIGVNSSITPFFKKRFLVAYIRIYDS